MSTVITDLTTDFFAYWESVQGLDPAKQQHLWHELYEGPHRTLFAASGDRYGSPEALSAALARYPYIMPELRNALPRLRAAIEEAGPALSQLFGLEELNLRVVLLVGMFWSDGWVIEIDGQPTCFFAVENLGPPPLADVLIAHELAHVAHAACLAGGWSTLNTLGHELFLEGLATLASSLLAPGLDEASYLWSSTERTRRGLDLGTWLAKCESVWPVVSAEMQQVLETSDLDIIAPYFLGDRAPSNLPERIGYFAGFRLVRTLADGHAIDELARWPPARIRDHMALALERAG